MKNGIDLHIHSNHSDGTCSVEEIFKLATVKNLDAISLTDHDTVSGCEALAKLCENSSCAFVPGIELSAHYNFKDVHILGYFVDYKDDAFLKKIKKIADTRIERNEKILSNLRDAGFHITMEDLVSKSDGVITRGNIANYLYETKQIKNINEAFVKYIGDDGPCFVAREKMDAVDAIHLIHKAKGIAFLAHPVLYHLSDKEMDEMLSDLKKHKLDGIEALYSTYHNNEEAKMKQYAEKYQLIRSGGSDFHGSAKPYLHIGSGRGNLFIHRSIYDDMLQYYKEKMKL